MGYKTGQKKSTEHAVSHCITWFFLHAVIVWWARMGAHCFSVVPVTGAVGPWGHQALIVSLPHAFHAVSIVFVRWQQSTHGLLQKSMVPTAPLNQLYLINFIEQLASGIETETGENNLVWPLAKHNTHHCLPSGTKFSCKTREALIMESDNWQSWQLTTGKLHHNEHHQDKRKMQLPFTL